MSRRSFKCQRMNHYASMCRIRTPHKQVHEIKVVHSESDGEIFVWTQLKISLVQATIQPMNNLCRFVLMTVPSLNDYVKLVQM